jgi:hypothetical protein
MAIQVASFLTPKTGASYFVLEDIHFRGGMRVIASESLRDVIPVTSRKSGMLVWTQDTLKMWQLLPDLVTWTEFSAGPKHITYSPDTAQDVWVINHEFNTKLFLYNIFDEGQQVISPKSISSTTTSITIDFGTPCLGTAIVQFLI